MPFIIFMLIIEAVGVDLSNYRAQIKPLIPILGIIILAYAMIVPAYRAKLASEAYGERDMPFWEAHSVSGTIFRSHLSFIPVIGQFLSKPKA
jgi:hypothetical protein